MKFIIKNTIIGLLTLLFLFFTCQKTFSHSLLPDEIVEYIENNPNASDEEIEQFFEDTYGYSIEEFWEKNPDPADELFNESREFIDQNLEDMENPKILESDKTKEILSRDILQQNNKFNNLDKSSKEVFLQKSLKLKNQNMSSSEKIKIYLVIGIQHVLEGLDHILFILSIALLSSRIKNLLILTTIFTVSHSITIFLAGFEIVKISAKIIEPIIALSIVYTFFTFLFYKYIKVFQNYNYHIITIFIFGLFHGLGFSSAFSSLNIDYNNYILALFSLNLGVEIGQILILIFAYPLFWMIKNQKNGHIVLQLFAILCIIRASIWFFERI
jgi:hydrogenase/urease accessory protein HupE